MKIRHIYSITGAFLIALVFVFSACKDQSKQQKSSYLKILLRAYHDSQFRSEDMDTEILILKNRINAAMCTADIKPIGDSLIDINLYGETNIENAKRLFLNGIIQFWELYSLTDLVKENSLVNAEKAMAKFQTTQSSDSNSLSYTTNKNSLSNYIRFSTDQTGLILDVDDIGVVLVKDTAILRNYLESPVIKVNFPSDLIWMYGIPRTEQERRAGYVPLYAIKTYGSNKAKIGNDAIISVGTTYNPVIKKPEIDFTMNNQGAKIWADMTGQNIGKCIAITLDYLVYSAPRVNDRIEGGRSSIEGNFDKRQAEDLVAILKAGKPRALLSILSIKKISKQ